MTVDVHSHKGRGTKKRYLADPSVGKYPRSDPRGRPFRPVPTTRLADIDNLEWDVFELATEFSDSQNPYLGVVLSWDDIIADEMAMEVWDDFLGMLCPGVPRCDLCEVAVLHTEPRSWENPYRRTALHGNLGNIHTPTGKKLYPFLTFRDEKRIQAWRMETNRKFGWPDPEDPMRLRPWSGPRNKMSARTVGLMRYGVVPFLTQKLQESNGRPLSVDERCRLLIGHNWITSARPEILQDEECIFLEYRQYDNGPIRRYAAHGTLFWHGNVWWDRDRICAERRTPKRIPRENPKALARYFNYLKDLNHQAEEFCRDNILPEIRPILARLDRRIASLAPPLAPPDFAPKENLIEAPALIAPIPFVPQTPAEAAAKRLLRTAKKSINYEPDRDI